MQPQRRFATPAVTVVLAIVAILGSTACSSPVRPADMVVMADRVWTGDPAMPWAQGVAIYGDTIEAVGSRSEIQPYIDDRTVILDSPIGFAAPGFIDSHVHFLSGGFGLSSVQLRDAATPGEFAERIGEFAAATEAGTWILEGNWDHELWGGDLPTRDWIDALTPEHPVFVHRLDGHMALANSAALAAAGVTAATPEVEGGTIVRDPTGRPTGLLKDNAMGLVGNAIPPAPDDIEDRALTAAAAYVGAQGVTTVHHMGTWDDLAAFERARARGDLGTRIYACVPLATWERLRDRIADSGDGDDQLRIGCLKAMVDGSLGSHTAAFHEPFTDAPGDTGLLVTDPADLVAWTAAADAAGLQVNVHAIGDRAIDTQLEAFARVIHDNGSRDRRFRIEHAQHPTAAAIGRLAELGVIASMQPYHAIDDGRWAEKVIGPERAATTYAFRSLLDAGATVAFGSDWAVAPATPLEGIYAAVTRRTLDGANPDGWVPAQKITVEEALHAYTVAGAYASFEEGRKGSLSPGKLADIVVLDHDPTAIPPADILETQVLFTVVGGRIVHNAVRDAALAR